VLLIILGLVTFIVSLWDIATGQDWFQQLLAAYAILIILGIVLVAYTFVKKPAEVKDTSIEKFEQSLEGSLQHFKCPQCAGVFAVKKSKHNNKKPLKITCPDCGAVGVIPPTPKVITGDIPEKKSASIKFQCNRCKEWVTIWAEGTDLYQDLQVYSCPYCGNKQPLHRV
jgi:predicted RNA-binding Zn-ribbon protein involved in translation (DUF1610 family)/DNA-directed RNA polymerase subunit RPC12/RpoP